MQSRLTVPLQGSWRFQADPDNEGVKQQWYERGLPEGAEVTIPHTWNVQAGLEEFRGTGWYAYSFECEPAWSGKTLRLQFDAAYRDAVVWVNGSKAGEHTGSGYTAFAFDISAYVQERGMNVIVVSVNNENSDTALPISNSFDWADDGGLIRGVSLIVTGEFAVDYAKLDAKPTFAESDQSIAEYGVIGGSAKLWGATALPGEHLDVSVTVRYGNTVIATDTYEAPATGQVVRLRDLRIERPYLWHFDHPHLYEVQLAIGTEGRWTDEVVVHLGFREITTSGSKLLLNREPVRLMGVEWMPGSHPDRGMAETEEQLAETLRQIKHANCVITRFHWQQDSKLLDWCDRNGLLVQEEIPHWQKPAEPNEELLPLARQHAEEMINRHYHHACVYAWGIGNEVDGQHPDTVAYMQALKQYALELDSTRLINYVSNTVHLDPASDATGAGDLIFWNDYIGTWHGDLDRAKVIAQMTADYPDKPIVVAEYGLCEPAFEGGDARRERILIENTEEYRKHPGIAALIYFSLNDYRTQMGEEGEGRLRQRVHGSTDLYGKPKPSYEALRRTGAPVTLSVVANAQGNVSLVVAARDDVPSHRIAGYVVELTSPSGQSEKLVVPALQPGERCLLQVPAALTRHGEGSVWSRANVRIVRPTGYSVLEGKLSEFFDTP